MKFLSISRFVSWVQSLDVHVCPTDQFDPILFKGMFVVRALPFLVELVVECSAPILKGRDKDSFRDVCWVLLRLFSILCVFLERI